MSKKYTFSRENGGTIVGLILGLVIGLGVALGMALMLNSGNNPFVDRADQRIKLGGHPIVDPNKPLYGNPVQSGLATQLNPSGLIASAPSSAPIAVGSPGPSLPTPAPKDTLAPTNQEEATSGPSTYLQVGAFQDAAEAQRAKVRMALLGIESEISSTVGPNGTLYRVRMGPYKSLDALNHARSLLVDNSVDATLVTIK